jgi:GT2 family glycosyltransferase/glycosyltransferase involved in cell wall biosynthesis
VADPAPLPTVSVIVVNYRGAEDTVTCLRALREDLDYPAGALQIICVDNASGDGSAAKIRAVGGVEVLEAPANLGFAGGCNLGARHATGTVLAFLNNDARPAPGWARAAVEVLRGEPTVAAVASKVLDWDGATIDFVDAGMTWFGMGYKRHAGEPATGHDQPRDVLFATGSAMFVRAGVFRELGGFDERFFMFYEDVDLGWRLNLRGWRVRYEPRSLAYHRHHASVSTVDTEDGAREWYLLERNALATLYKNFSDQTLATVLPAALALTVRRATARGELDPTQLEIVNRPAGPEPATVPVPKTALAGVLAVDQFVELLPSLAASRKAEQAARVRSDADLIPLLRKAMEPAFPLPRYLAAHQILVDVFGIEDVFDTQRRVLVLTGDAIGEQMAGPAIRAWHIASVLAAEHEVRLVTTNPVCAAPDDPFPVKRANRLQLGTHVDWADVVVLQGHTLELAPGLKKRGSTKIVVCDLYDPMHLELLEQGRDPGVSASGEERATDLAAVTGVLNNQLRRGDFFLCASERQRHLWLGHLAALGRLNPAVYDTDPTVRSLLAVAPFGLSGNAPRRTASPIRGRLTGENDKVVLWAGGLYSWLDPLTLVRAIGRLAQDHPDVRLVFLGMRHPNPEVPAMDIGVHTRQLAAGLGLTDKHVFFNESWVPYAERQNWLLDADCGVITHHDHVETTFAFRTRVLDYLWAGLPIVTTDGDALADLVRTEWLGVVVPPEDPAALAEALRIALYDAEFAAAARERIAAVRERFTWEAVLAPLISFCRNPMPAPDRLPGAEPLTRNRSLPPSEAARRDLALVKQYLADGGATELARRAAGRVRRIARDRIRRRSHD